MMVITSGLSLFLEIPLTKPVFFKLLSRWLVRHQVFKLAAMCLSQKSSKNAEIYPNKKKKFFMAKMILFTTGSGSNVGGFSREFSDHPIG